MKKLIALMFCLSVLATAALAQAPQQQPKPQVPSLREQISQPRKMQAKWPAPIPQRQLATQQPATGKKATMQQAVEEQVQAAQKQKPVTIAGDKRLVTVTLEIQQLEEGSQYLSHQYWTCPAVIFTKDGALAFDGECWEAFTQASKLRVGPSVIFTVDLGKLGDYTQGKYAGYGFFFQSSYAADGPVPYNDDGVEVFKMSADRSYITYNLSLFNEPENSEVKQAIADYYQQNNLQQVSAQTLSQYFKGTHPSFKDPVTPLR